MKNPYIYISSLVMISPGQKRNRQKKQSARLRILVRGCVSGPLSMPVMVTLMLPTCNNCPKPHIMKSRLSVLRIVWYFLYWATRIWDLSRQSACRACKCEPLVRTLAPECPHMGMVGLRAGIWKSQRCYLLVFCSEQSCPGMWLPEQKQKQNLVH